MGAIGTSERDRECVEFPVTSGQSPELPPESGQTAGARESTGWLTDELSQIRSVRVRSVSQSVSQSPSQSPSQSVSQSPSQSVSHPLNQPPGCVYMYEYCVMSYNIVCACSAQMIITYG